MNQLKQKKTMSLETPAFCSIMLCLLSESKRFLRLFVLCEHLLSLHLHFLIFVYFLFFLSVLLLLHGQLRKFESSFEILPEARSVQHSHSHSHSHTHTHSRHLSPNIHVVFSVWCVSLNVAVTKLVDMCVLILSH